MGPFAGRGILDTKWGIHSFIDWYAAFSNVSSSQACRAGAPRLVQIARQRNAFGVSPAMAAWLAVCGRLKRQPVAARQSIVSSFRPPTADHVDEAQFLGQTDGVSNGAPGYAEGDKIVVGANEFSVGQSALSHVLLDKPDNNLHGIGRVAQRAPGCRREHLAGELRKLRAFRMSR